MVVLTTAYDQHALKAFELEVRDYLVKLIHFERFYKLVLRLYQVMRPMSPPEIKEDITKKEDDYIFLKVGHRQLNFLISFANFYKKT